MRGREAIAPSYFNRAFEPEVETWGHTRRSRFQSASLLPSPSLFLSERWEGMRPVPEFPRQKRRWRQISFLRGDYRPLFPTVMWFHQGGQLPRVWSLLKYSPYIRLYYLYVCYPDASPVSVCRRLQR